MADSIIDLDKLNDEISIHLREIMKIEQRYTIENRSYETERLEKIRDYLDKAVKFDANL